MSVSRERERIVKAEKKSSLRDGSSSRNPKRKVSEDRRSIVSQENPTKQKPPTTISKEKVRSEKAPPLVDKPPDGRKSDGGGKHEKSLDRVSNKVGKEIYGKIKRDSKPDTIYLKDVLERKMAKREVDKKEERKEVHRKKRIESMDKKEEKPKNRRERTRTRTLSPTEIKQLIPTKMAEGDQVKEVKVTQKEREKSAETGGGDGEYEDDFEDYESDFEEDNSERSEIGTTVEEDQNINEEPEAMEEMAPRPKSLEVTRENSDPCQQKVSQEPQNIAEAQPETPKKSLDKRKINFERPRQVFEPMLDWKFNIQKQQMEEIRKSIEKENIEVAERRKLHSNSLELEQEQINQETEGEAMIDFRTTSENHRKVKEVAAARKRGEELLSMISLDAITYAIMEIPPIPYEIYMKTFGKSNTKQVHVQTNEDNLKEEIQTDEILTCNRWTQYPPEYLGRKKAGQDVCYVLTKEERLGVGEDRLVEEDKFEEEEEVVINSKTNGLLNFLSWSSQVVLAALERKSGNVLNLETMPNRSKEMTFGDGFICLNLDEVSFLKDKSVTQVRLLNKNSKKLLSVHMEKNKYFQRSLICVWSLRELSKPLKILVASNRVTSICFGPDQGNLVFAGLSDGSLCLWDLREASAYHNQLINDPNWTVQSPTYTTAGDFDEIENLATVVSVQLIEKSEKFGKFEDFTPLQICSLDKNGTVTIWSVIQIEKNQKNKPSEDLGLAHWGRLKLVKSSSFCIFDNLRDEIPGLYITCNDMIINEGEEDGFYIANSFGSVQHTSTYGSLMKPKFFVPSNQNVIIETTCLELCPFDGNYFLVGCRDGSIRLHCRHQGDPLITLNPDLDEGEREASVVSLSWTNTRPCVFFALDSRSRIQIWNLGVSDMYPEMNLNLTDKKITCMKLLDSSDLRQVPFLVIGTEGGRVEIHRLKKEYGSRSASEVRSEMKMFLKYVSIL